MRMLQIQLRGLFHSFTCVSDSINKYQQPICLVAKQILWFDADIAHSSNKLRDPTGNGSLVDLAVSTE